MATLLKDVISSIDKRDPRTKEEKEINIIEQVEGKTAILVDDIIDTAGTITIAADALVEKGAKEVYACCTHAVLSGPALERIEQSEIRKLVVTNTIKQTKDKLIEEMTVLSVAPLIAQAIIRTHELKSLSILFDS